MRRKYEWAFQSVLMMRCGHVGSGGIAAAEEAMDEWRPSTEMSLT